MARFNTKAGITWSDDQGFDAQSIIDLYNQIQVNKRADAAEARAADRLQMAKDEMDRMRVKEQKLIGSQRLLNNAVMQFQNASGWEEGKYDPSKLPDVKSSLEGYLEGMNELGQAGDAMTIGGALSSLKSAQLAKDAQILQQKVAIWDSANKNKYKDLNPFNNHKFVEDRQAYLKSINADKLYANIHGSFGQMKALESTGLTPDDFGKSGKSFIVEHPIASAGVGIASAGGVWSAVNAMKNSIDRGEALLTKSAKAQSGIAKIKAELANLKGKQPSKDVLSKISRMEKYLNRIEKVDYFDETQWKVLDKLSKDIPKDIDVKGIKKGTESIKKVEAKLSKAEKAYKKIGTPTTTSSVLRKMKALLPFSAPLVGAGIDEAVGMEAPVAETAGTVIMGAAQKKPFLQFLGSKLPARVAPKALALAAADGPLPWGELLGLGFTAYEIIRLFNEWKDLADN